MIMDIRNKANYTSSNTFERSKTCREALVSASLNISFEMQGFFWGETLKSTNEYNYTIEYYSNK